jgi:hypothetical protein
MESVANDDAGASLSGRTLLRSRSRAAEDQELIAVED